MEQNPPFSACSSSGGGSPTERRIEALYRFISYFSKDSYLTPSVKKAQDELVKLLELQ